MYKQHVNTVPVTGYNGDMTGQLQDKRISCKMVHVDDSSSCWEDLPARVGAWNRGCFENGYVKISLNFELLKFFLGGVQRLVYKFPKSATI